MEQWFRSWHGAPTDPKWLAIARRSNVAPGMISAIFWALLDYASQNNVRGSVEGFDVETYALWAGWDEAQVAASIEAMRAKGVIDENNMLTAWEKRQPKRNDDSAERVRKYRERNAGKVDVTQSNASVTQSNASVTQSNAEKRRVTLDKIRKEERRTEKNRTEKNRTEKNRTEQNRAEQNRAEQTGDVGDENGESVCLSDCLSDAAHLLEQHNIEATEYRIEQTSQAISDFGLETVEDAFAIAANKGKKDWNYILGILRRKRNSAPVNGNGVRDLTGLVGQIPGDAI